MRKIINDGIEALTRKSQARFQIIKVLCSGEPRIRLNNLKTSLGFPCLSLNPIKDSINIPIADIYSVINAPFDRITERLLIDADKELLRYVFQVLLQFSSVKT